MKKIVSFILNFSLVIFFLVPFLPLSVAQEENVLEENDLFEERAGITPDSQFYILDLAFDQLGLVITFDQNKKIERRLNIAEERLLETKEMAEKEQYQEAETAENKYSLQMNSAEDEIRWLKEGSSPSETKKSLENMVRIREKILRHYRQIHFIQEKILEKNKKTITPEQTAKIEAIFEKINGKAEEIETEAWKKEETVKKRLMEQGKIGIDEVDKIVKELEQKTRENTKSTIQEIKTKAELRVEKKKSDEKEMYS